MILVIDNYDSFTYNLVQYLGMCGAVTEVFRNDQITIDQIRAKGPRGIMLSPGPCTPSQSGVCLGILENVMEQRHDELKVPLFGVCLGHQAIGLIAGAKVHRADRIMHGKTSMVEHDEVGLFEGMPQPFRAVRYHSLVVQKDAPPAGFDVTARSTDDGEIMGLRHQSLPIEGVQFHPESVLTEDGLRIVQNFVTQVERFGE